MKKKILSLLIVLTFVIGMLPGAVMASGTTESVAFFNAESDRQIGTIDNQSSVYAKVSFTAPKDGTASIIAAKYDERGTLICAEVVATPVMTKDAAVECTTADISVSGADTLKIMGWDGFLSMTPVLKNPGILKGLDENSSFVKFEKAAEDLTFVTGTTVELGSIFKVADPLLLDIDTENVEVSVVAVEGSTASGTYTKNTEDWTKGTLSFSGLGEVAISVTDNYYCTPTTVTATVKEPDPVDKFTAKENLEFKHTLESTEVTKTLGDLFEAVEGADIDNSNVTVTGATCTLNTEDWTKSEVKFKGKGEYTVTITDNKYCNVATVTVKVLTPDPINKFAAKENLTFEHTVQGGTIEKTLGDIFAVVENVTVKNESIKVTVTDSEGVKTTLVENSEDWTQSTLSFSGAGAVVISITDNYYCNEATATVTITEPESADKFKEKDNLTFKHTIDDTVVTKSIGEIFTAIEGADIDSVKVTVMTNSEKAVYTPDTADWTKGTLKFEGAGEYVVTISDNNYCKTATATVTINEPDPIDKFVAKTDLTFKHTIESSIVTKTLGDLFEAKDGANINSSKVTVTVSGENATYAANTEDWTKGTITFDGADVVTVTITDNNYCNEEEAVVTIEEPDPIDKFVAKSGLTFNLETEGEGITKTLGEIFEAKDDVIVKASDIKVEGAECAQNVDDWTQSTLTFGNSGTYTVTITDNYYCNKAQATVTVLTPESTDKFALVFENTDKYLYRVGNQNTVALGSLFKAKDGADIGTVKVTISDENAKYTSNSDWTKSTIQFAETGPVTVTIDDNKFTNELTLNLEVVDAKNATGVQNATANNVVLLNDCGFSSFEVSGGYALYGNGFKMTCASDSPALDMGYSFVTLNNGTLDNVQIVCPNYDYAALYKSNLTSSDNRSETTDKTRYYNAKSGVMASGNSQILNSRISGGRASLNVSGGNVVVDNSRIELGAVASVLVGSANSLVLRDTTLVQKPTVSTHDSNKTLMGFSVLYMCDANGNATPTTIEGSFVQQAWIDEGDSTYVPSAGKDIVTSVLKETDYLHDVDGDGINESLNLGFAYMPEDVSQSVAQPTNITDNRTDKATIPYEMKGVDVRLSILSITVYVYSYKNTNGTADSFKVENNYIPNTQSDIITVDYSDSQDGLEQSKSYGTDGWVYELNVDLDKLSGYALDFNKVTMNINGVAYTDFKVNGGNKPTSPIAVTAGGTDYVLTATVDGKEYKTIYKVTGTETSKESPSLVAANYEAGLCIASSYGGTWHGAAPALEGIQIKYWSVAEKQYKTINLSDYTPTTKGQLNGVNTTWTYSPANGDFTLTLTGGQVHSGNNVYAMPVVCDGKLYYVPAKSSGLVNSGNSARTIPVSYSFKDNNNGDELKFSHTWSVEENKDAQYGYSDFCNGTKTQLTSSSSGGGSCIVPETMITLADGSQKQVQDLTGEEMLLVWNLEKGTYDTAPIVFVDSEDTSEYEVVDLKFSDGSNVGVIYEHGFFDLDLGKYVYLRSENAKDYIGHRFVKQADVENNTWESVVLEDVVIENRITKAYSPVTFEHLCYYTNGVLSMPGGIEGLFNIFEVDTEIMAYDTEKMLEDINAYGLFTYNDFADLIPEIAYEAFNGDILKVSIGKGMLTWEDIEYLAERYVPLV